MRVCVYSREGCPSWSLSFWFRERRTIKGGWREMWGVKNGMKKTEKNCWQRMKISLAGEVKAYVMRGGS